MFSHCQDRVNVTVGHSACGSADAGLHGVSVFETAMAPPIRTSTGIAKATVSRSFRCPQYPKLYERLSFWPFESHRCGAQHNRMFRRPIQENDQILGRWRGGQLARGWSPDLALAGEENCFAVVRVLKLRFTRSGAVFRTPLYPWRFRRRVASIPKNKVTVKSTAIQSAGVAELEGPVAKASMSMLCAPATCRLSLFK